MKRLKDSKGRTLEEFLAGYCPGDYPLPSVTADIVLLSKSDNKYEVLLIKRGGHPFLDHWALPGGFTEPGETVYTTAQRELFEETSLSDLPLEELGLFSTPNRDPRNWTMTSAYFTIAEKNKIKPIAADDAMDVMWFDISIDDSNTKTRLTFAGDETISVSLEKNIRAGITKNIVTFKTLENDGLAFDHAEIIATALERIGAISSNL